MSFIKEFEKLKIELEDIKSATNNFSENAIGSGGFGRVYKGELSLPNGRSMFAFKRLDRSLGQGDNEFWKEVMMLSKCRHENLISLQHFCNDGAEKILVYEYASRGSLDRYLKDTSLTWIQRLKICVGAARGLNYLHDPIDSQQRILHRDIKSSNILLDDEWNAKISDFGLSKIGPANQQHTFLFSNAVGTPGYCDPLYWELGFLTKESDVYSFGVVLFEVMCGRLCYEYSNGQLSRILVTMWKKCYQEKRLDEIISPGLKQQMRSDSLDTFSAIAYRCLNKDHEERPMTADILKELEIALEQQEFDEDKINLSWIADLAVPPLSYRSQKQLLLLLSKGILVDWCKTWFSVDKKGRSCEIISAGSCMFGDSFQLTTTDTSRFSNVLRYPIFADFEVEVFALFLSPNVTYTINLVFNYDGKNWSAGPYVPFKYKVDKEEEYSTSHIAQVREDGLLMTELYQFTAHKKEHRFRILFVSPSSHDPLNRHLLLEGIEFRAVENEKLDNSKDKNKVDMQPISDLDTDWHDYEKMIKLSKYNMQWTTKHELYALLRKGFLVDNGEKWFFVDKNMKKCHMVSAREICDERWISKSPSESRFGVVFKSPDMDSFVINYKVNNSQLVSPKTMYGCYLVYKLPPNHLTFGGLMKIEYRSSALSVDPEHIRLMSLVARPHTPTIRPKVHPKSQEVPREVPGRKIKGHPKTRKDGWMELQLWEECWEYEWTWMRMDFHSCDGWSFDGLLVQGIEYRPWVPFGPLPSI